MPEAIPEASNALIVTVPGRHRLFIHAGRVQLDALFFGQSLYFARSDGIEASSDIEVTVFSVEVV